MGDFLVDFFSTGYVLSCFLVQKSFYESQVEVPYISNIGTKTPVRLVWNDSLACSGGKVQTRKQKPTSYELEKSLLLRQKRPQKEFGYQLFFALATTAIFKRCNVIPKLIKFF